MRLVATHNIRSTDYILLVPKTNAYFLKKEIECPGEAVCVY